MYQTFMNAYTLVDAQTRRKLDEMLKTWKEPVPGSLDTRPVFPPEITRSIESALIKARTAALQQEQARGSRDILNRGRNTGTPPSMSRQPNNHHGTNGQGYGTPVRYSRLCPVFIMARLANHITVSDTASRTSSSV